MAQYDGAIRIDTSIITKNVRPKVQEIAKSLEEIGKDAEKAREKLELLDKAGVSHASEEYKAAQAELQKYVDAYKDSMYEIAEYGQGVSDSLQFDTSKIDAAREKLQSMDASGIDHSSKEYKEAERDLKHVIDAYERYREVIDEFDSYTKTAFDGFKKLRDETEKYINTSDTQAESTDEVSQHLNILRIDVEEYAKALKELHDQGKFFGDEDYNKVYLAWKNATDAVKTYQSELNKQTESGQAKIAQQEAKAAEKREAAQRRAEEQAEKALQKENARIQKEVENQAKLEAKEAERKAREEARINAIQAKEEAKRAKEIAAIQAQEQEEQRLAAIRENAVVGNQRIVEIMERRRQLAQEIADMEQAGVGVGYQQHDTAKQEIALLDQEIKNYADGVEEVKESYSRLGQTAKKAFSIAHSAISKAGSRLKRFGGFVKSVFSNLTKSAHKSNSSLGALGSRFKSLALSLLIFNQISKAFNAMISGMKEGFGNLYNEVGSFKSVIDGLKASSLTLKNSFAAAFRPLVEIAIPYIQRAIDAIANLMNMIGQFTAAITGQKTYTKAVKQTTAAIEGQTKAQNKQLSGLDKLNNLTSNSGGGGAGGGAGNMFEEAPIEGGILGIFEKLKELIENKDWEGLGAYIAEAINKGLQKVYDVINWNNVGPRVTAFVDAFTRTFNSLIDHLDWDLLGRVIGAGINTIVNTLNLLIEGIDWKNLGTKISVGMRGLINEVDWGNLGNLLGSKFMIQWDIFTGFVDDMLRKNDFTKLSGWAELGISLGNALNGVFEKIDLAQIGSTLGRAITGMFQSVIYFSETFKWKELGDNVANGINNFFSETNWATVGQGFSDFVIGLLDSLIAAIEGTNWRQIGESIGDFLASIDWNGIVSRIARAFGAALGGLATLLVGAIQDAVISIRDHFLGYLIDAMGGLDKDASIWEIGWAIVQGMFNGIVDTIKGIGTWIYEHIFQPFIEGFKNAFGIHSPSTVMEEMGRFLMEGLFNGISSLVDKVLSVFTNIKEKITGAWDWIKEKVTGTTTELHGRVSEDFDGMQDKIAETLRTSRQTTDTEWDGISGSVSNQMEYMKGNSRQALDSIGKHISNTWTNVESNTRSTMDKTGRKIVDTWNESQKNTTRTLSAMKNTVASNASLMASNMSSKLINMRGSINSFSVNAKSTWSNTYDTMKAKNVASWNDISRVSNNGMHKIGNTISSEMNRTKNTWGNIWDAIFGKVSSILGSIQGAVSSALNAISGMISAINGALDSLFAKADSASKITIPSKGGGGVSGNKNKRETVPRMASNYSADVYASLSEMPIPRLATGTVVPPNNEFLAVLGDNKREPEVVSPLSTIEQAVENAMRRNGGMGGGEITIKIPVEIDGRVLFELMKKFDLEQYRRTGRSSFQM